MNFKHVMFVIRSIVDEHPAPGAWPDDIDGRCGGNYDDAFAAGVEYGERVLAERIRNALAAHAPKEKV